MFRVESLNDELIPSILMISGTYLSLNYFDVPLWGIRSCCCDLLVVGANGRDIPE